MASKIKATSQKEDVPEKETPETAPDSPLLDLSDAAVKKLIRSAKKCGYVTHDQINSVLSSEEVNSEQIEDVLAMFSEMGVNVVETEEPSEEGEEPRDEADEEAESESGELVEVQQKVPAKSETKEPTERTDDPVRMYLREMSSVELLSREGEIAIAKRIEAGREVMIAGLCESPLTFQAIIIWRDELNEGKVCLRDIIDLEATYAGPDAKAMLAPVLGSDGQPIVTAAGASPAPGASVLMQTPAPPAAPAAATPFKGATERDNGEEGEGGEATPSEADFDDDDMENSLSLAAIEAELKPKVLETFDNNADASKRLRRLQDQDIQNKLLNEAPTPWPASPSLRRRSSNRDARGIDYSMALVERLSAFFIMLIGFQWVCLAVSLPMLTSCDLTRRVISRGPPQGPRLGGRRAQRSGAAHLRGVPARRRTDHAQRARGRVWRLARARAPDRRACLREGAEVGERRRCDGNSSASASALASNPLQRWRTVNGRVAMSGL